MEKIKFKNVKKYKGIVEQVLVKEGQPVKKDQILAIISTQLEKFDIRSTTDGVIRNIYVIESLIVSHGDTIFDIFSYKEMKNLLKKPSNMNDTLKDGLSEFGYLEKLINESDESDEEEFEEVKPKREKKTEVLAEKDLDILDNFETEKYLKDEIIESEFQIEEEFTEDPIAEAKMEPTTVQTIKTETSTFEIKENPTIVTETITKKVVYENSDNFKDSNLFSDEISTISQSEILEELSKNNTEDNLEVVEIKQKPKNIKKQETTAQESNSVFLKELDYERLEKVLKNSEKLNNKFKEIEKKLSSFMEETKETNNDNEKSINSIVKKIDEKSKSINSKLEEVELKATENSKLVSNSIEKKVIVDKTNIGSFSFKLDITALISLQTLMIEPSKEENVDLELNAFYVKALKRALTKFEELDSSHSFIRLVKTDGYSVNDTVVKVSDDLSILDISKEIHKNQLVKDKEVKVAIYDISNFGLDNANFGLTKNSILSIYISSISSSFKDDGNLTNYVKINFAFNQNSLEPEDAIMFGKEFISILKNPGFLI
ncbi:acetyl-CoA carboxylase biotin carboxyl carrier protein subunit [Spiroplasma endosymbiont of Cantharis nigra]|uniref:acetyl-CoA carboxylase biotin carboxyl carrier protein subunit n=1 Tax=Spiroplasma endosymbiont of Cantharis nigra TaxID=3066278 RepID=UPI0030D25FCC